MDLFEVLAVVGIVSCICLVAYITRISDAMGDLVDEIAEMRCLLQNEGVHLMGDLQVPPIDEWRAKREAE